MAKSTCAGQGATTGNERSGKTPEFLHEIQRRVLHPKEMLQLSHVDLVPVDIVLDCEDVWQKLWAPVLGSQQDWQMQVHTAALRKDRDG